MSGESGEPFGLLLVDKPAGPTSHDVVAWARWALRTRRVGHCGTLDPGATGLVVLTVGAATRLSELLTAADKVYEAAFALGTSTATDDAAGEVVARAGVTPEALAAAGPTLLGMVGELELRPPRVSAIKLGGRRAHARVRAGEDFELPPRAMALRAVDGVRVDAGGCRVEATVHVHKGTYVRSLAVELGRRLGIPAHLAMLRRTRSGLARLDDPRVLRPVALRLPPLAPGAPPGPPRYRLTLREPTDLTGAGDTGRGEDGEQLRRQLVPVVELLGLPTLGVSEELQARLRQGQRIPVSALGWQPREGDRAVVLGADVGGPLTIVEARPNPRGAGADPRGPAFPPELARDPLVAQPAWTLQP